MYRNGKYLLSYVSPKRNDENQKKKKTKKTQGKMAARVIIIMKSKKNKYSLSFIITAFSVEAKRAVEFHKKHYFIVNGFI